jgi:hypothetical protein
MTDMTPIVAFPTPNSSGDAMARNFQHLVEVGPGHWNIRGALPMACGIVDIGCHMSLMRLKNGRFLVIDTIKLLPEIKSEIDELTQGGVLMEACIATHPFHTLFFAPFSEAYPACKLVGTPRHIKRFPSLQWDGFTVDQRLQEWEALGVQMRIPAGAEFVAPHENNHFSSVFVFHEDSMSIFTDDTLMFYDPRHAGGLLNCITSCTGVSNSLQLHPSLTDGSRDTGLFPTASAPAQFQEWFANILADWDFDTIVTAHTGCKVVTHPPTHSLTHSLTHPPIHSPTHPLTHSYTHT